MPRTMSEHPDGAVFTGRRLGVYQVAELLGAGGMGQVYRARDVILNRDVAIKVLLPAVANDPDRLARFSREAQVLASLNHPHIAQIHGLENAEGVRALVMELVDGPTLADRIAHGAIPMAEALLTAKQIAEALEAAHEQGIIHRDLKPANIKVRADGVVKVLDFGLAKALDPLSGPPAEALTDSPTMSSPAGMTAAGIILGTAAYMSPEQARGKPVDKRADIWAFGVLLFEMLTGRRPFSGGSIADVLAAVLTHEPDFSALPTATSARVRDLLGRCLQKDPQKRLRDIGEARVAIDATLGGEEARTVAVAPPRAAPLWRRALPWTIAAIGFAVAVWMVYGGFGSRPVEPRWQRFTQLTDLAGEERAPIISPDGTLLAYTSRARGSWDIYVQRIGGRNPVLVAGDPERQESSPAFSPDGQHLAFHEEDADGGLFIIGATGESLRRLTDTGFHPAWSPDGRSIVYCTEAVAERGPSGRMGTSALWVVDVDAGRPRKIDDGDAVQPVWSPSGARIAFGASVGRDLYTIPAAGGARVPVVQDAALDWSPAWAPDGRWLYFTSDRGGTTNLWRIAVDEFTGAAVGAPEPVTVGAQAADLPSLSKDGTKLLFRSRLTTVNPVAVPFDPETERLGAPTRLLERNGVLSPKAVSPDSEWLALGNFGEQREDIFIVRKDGSDLRRLTDDGARDRAPQWSPDGRELAFYSNDGGGSQIWTIRSDGSRRTQLTDVKGGGIMYPLWSPAGDRMVASMPRAENMVGFLWPVSNGWPSARELPGLRTPEGWLRSLDWSPNGRRLAGVVQDAGANAVGIGWYDVNTGASATASHDRSPTPSDVQWLPDSRRILFVNDKGELVIVDAETKRRKVLPTPWLFQIADESVAVAPDGRTLYIGARKVESDIWMVER